MQEWRRLLNVDFFLTIVAAVESFTLCLYRLSHSEMIRLVAGCGQGGVRFLCLFFSIVLNTWARDGLCVRDLLSFVSERQTSRETCTLRRKHHRRDVRRFEAALYVRQDSKLEDAEPRAFTFAQTAARRHGWLVIFLAERYGADDAVVPELRETHTTAGPDEASPTNSLAAPTALFLQQRILSTLLPWTPKILQHLQSSYEPMGPGGRRPSDTVMADRRLYRPGPAATAHRIQRKHTAAQRRTTYSTAACRSANVQSAHPLSFADH